MQTITMYVAAAETLGVVRDSANAKNMAAPTLVRGCAVTLKMRLFADVNTDVPYPLAAFSGVTGWQFVMDDDFNSTTAYKLVADNEDITVETVTVGGVTYTEFTIPITEMNTDELEKWLRVDPGDAAQGHVESKSGLNAELVGYDGTEHVFVLQIKGYTVRSRIVSLEDPTPIHPEYYTAAEVDALVNGRLLAESPGAGAIMLYNGNEWQEQVGERRQAVTGDFTGLPGVLYTITLNAAKMIYIEAVADTDYEFRLLVTQGATAYGLTLLGDMYPMYFADSNTPPRYASGNTQPSVSTANTAYMFRLRWDSVHSVLLCNLEYTVGIGA